jgi:hypothetical protein
MSKEKELTLTASGLRDYLNKNQKCKKTLKAFTSSDVQNYVRRGHLPNYLGGKKIKEMKNIIGIRTFKISVDDKSKV